MLDFLVKRHFRVPLSANYPSLVVGRIRFDGLDYAAGAGCGYLDTRGGLGDRIAVDTDNIFQSGDARDVREFAVRGKINRVEVAKSCAKGEPLDLRTILQGGS